MAVKQRVLFLILCVTVLFIYYVCLTEMKKTNNETDKFSSTPNLEAIVETIRRDCGDLCNTNRKGLPGKYFDQITASIDCEALFRNEFIDLDHGLNKAPKDIPQYLWNDYTLNGAIPVTYYYFDEHFMNNPGRTPEWTERLINEYTSKARKGILVGGYGMEETNALREGLMHSTGIKNGRVLVIGSIDPWVEACVLEAGAREVVTLEYSQIVSTHPLVKTITPRDFRRRFLDRSLEKFDAIVSFSSVEHSGLGRYGDILNPWGDIIAVGKAWCVTKDNGSLTLAVMYDNNTDLLRFNADRFYGPIRFPFLTTNWKQVYRGQGFQKVHVFTKQTYQDNF